jgi:maleylpyruvate isomerase
MSASQASPSVLVADVVGLRLQLETLLDALTDDQVRGLSTLPGWTRGHVFAHLVGVGSAVARQVEHARVGRFVAFYDGGRAGRDAAIEAGATASASEHARDVRAAALRVEAALAALDGAGWDLRTHHRDGSVLDVAHAWWRELGIHLTDLDLGVTSDVWSPALREHLVAYLGRRVPEGVRLALRPDGDHPGWTVGSGAAECVEYTVRGDEADLVALLAGRAPRGPLAVEHDGVAATLPELDPWP